MSIDIDPSCARGAALSSVLFAAAIAAGTASAQDCQVCGGDHSGHSHTGTGEFNVPTRWTSTATQGGGLGAGDAAIITWSILSDGTSMGGGGNSDVVSFFDSITGAGPGGSDLTQRPWFPLIADSFGRWSELGAVSYVYEPNDSGTFRSLPGQLGVRGDVRIGGQRIDGNSGVLADNSFPDNGDMRIDTDDNSYFQSANNFRFLRNVIMHEHGHGLGFAHTDSNNSAILMEPFIQTSFDGPQMDDIRALHFAYGDVNEKNGGNDSVGTATPLGAIADGGSVVIGLDATTGTFVAPTDVDFVSVDNGNDTDFYSFSVSDPQSLLDVVLTPVGPTYNQSAQGGGGANTTDTSDDVDIALRVIDADGNTVLGTADANGLGGAESLSNIALDGAGTYFAQVFIGGNQTNMQFYTLDLAVTAVPEPASAALLGLVGLGLATRRRRAA